MHVTIYGSSTVQLWRSAQLHDNGVAYFIERRGSKLTHYTGYTVVFPITVIAYVVINENTVMLPVTYPVAHIMTIDVCTVVNDLDYLEKLRNDKSRLGQEC